MTKQDDKKLELWDKLFETPPSQTKPFKRAGGFSGTAIKPYWCIWRLTEMFGPAGEGWGWQTGESETIHFQDGEALFHQQVTLWYRDREREALKHEVGPHWGATMMRVKRLNGSWFVDEEAAKKAVTDGLMKCASYLGLGGDVHMGMFDDSKYLAEAKMDERKERELAEAEERREAKKAEKKKPAKKEEPEPEAEARGNGHDQDKPEEKEAFDLARWRDKSCADVRLLKTEEQLRLHWTSVVKPIIDKLMEGGVDEEKKVALYVHGKFKDQLAKVRGEPK